MVVATLQPTGHFVGHGATTVDVGRGLQPQVGGWTVAVVSTTQSGVMHPGSGLQDDGGGGSVTMLVEQPVTVLVAV